MRSTIATLVLGLLIIDGPTVHSASTGDGGIDDLIKEVFGDGTTTTRGAERVPAPYTSTTTYRPPETPGRQIPVYETEDGTSPTLEPPADGGGETLNGGNQEVQNGNFNNGGNQGNGLGGDECTCVPYYLCTSNNTVITDGSGLLDIRAKGGTCDNYMDVCCGEPNIVKEPVTPKPHGRLGCGKRNSDGVGFRITGNVDNESQFGEFPWMIALLKQEESSGKSLNVYQCGGALIHESVVVTAAHCVVGKEPNQLKVRAGEWDTQTKNEIYPHQDRSVNRIIVHERYHAGGLHNDIALLVVSEPFKFDENVDIVCLPRQNDVVLTKNCFASGWGKDVFGKEGHYQVILKKVELPMVPRDYCQSSLRKTRLGQHFKLHESFVCAGGELGKDTCKGDGGSPLVCPIANKDYKYQHVGIVAWGIGCGNTTPAVYVNVAYFRHWVDSHMKDMNFKIDYDYDNN